MRFDKLTTQFQQAFADAQSLAVGGDHAYIEPQHLLLALLNQEGGGAAAILFEPPAPADVSLPEIAVAVPQLRQRLGVLADRCYDSPSASVSVIGVTG
ncbi:MAG: Clp protease N-terminal domain-containing protein, partial [Gammaproteobacteria bacterium]